MRGTDCVNVERKIIRSNRKTLGLEVNAQGLIVRVLMKATDDEINLFILGHKRWIEKQLNKIEEKHRGRFSVTLLGLIREGKLCQIIAMNG